MLRCKVCSFGILCVGVLVLGAVVLGEVVLAVIWFCDGGGVFM